MILGNDTEENQKKTSDVSNARCKFDDYSTLGVVTENACDMPKAGAIAEIATAIRNQPQISENEFDRSVKSAFSKCFTQNREENSRESSARS
jgi:hypothetical protein